MALNTQNKKPKKVIVVGAGHNGLIAACYVARAGHEVLVLEQNSMPGGGSRTEEAIPGYCFDMHSVAHNIINMTDILHELDLAGAGLDYIEMNPFSVAIRANGQRVRFYRSIEQTVASIAENNPQDAKAYAEFMKIAVPMVHLVLPAIRGRMRLQEVPARIASIMKVLFYGHGPINVARDLLSPYDALLKRRLWSDLTRGPVSAFAVPLR